MVNWGKLSKLFLNSVPVATGSGIIFWLIFGFGWWILPISFVLGGASSLIMTRPKKLMLSSKDEKAQLALRERELDNQLEKPGYNSPLY